jgi:hypothetical protein
VNFDFFISKTLRSKQLRFCQIPLIQTGYILRDRVTVGVDYYLRVRSTDYFGLVKAVDPLVQGIVIAFAHAADRWLDLGLGKP